MNIIGIMSKGYAPATSGGAIFNLEIEVPANRFSFEDKPLISVCVENRTNKVRLTVISLSPGTNSLWGEDEELTEQETIMLKDWIKQNKLVEEANAIVAEDKRVTKEVDKIYEQRKAIFDSPMPTTVEEAKAKWESLDALDVVLKKLYAEREALKDIKI